MNYNHMTLEELAREIMYSDDPLLMAVYDKIKGPNQEDSVKLRKIKKDLEDAISRAEYLVKDIQSALDEVKTL